MSFHRVQYLLFDLDGTLLDSLPGIDFSMKQACQSVGIPEIKANLRSLLGPPIRTILSKAVPTEDRALLDRLEAAFRISYDTEGWQKTTCFEGALEALQEFREDGRRLFVISNKPRPIALRILEHEGMLALFKAIYTPDSRVPPFGSKEEIIKGFLTEQGVSPSECLMVGDTMEDVAAAAANEMPVVFMEHGYGEAEPAVPNEMRFLGFHDFRICLTMESAR